MSKFLCAVLGIAYLYRLESKRIARSLFTEDCVCDLSPWISTVFAMLFDLRSGISVNRARAHLGCESDQYSKYGSVNVIISDRYKDRIILGRDIRVD